MRLKELFPNAKPQGEILVLGELLMDFVPYDKDMRLSQAGPVVKTVSGSAGIYACAAAGFGAPCSFIGKLGADAFSQLARAELTRYGVCAEHIVSDSGGQLGLAFLEYTPTGRNYIYYRDNSVGSRLKPEEIPSALFSNAQLLHLPGMLLELNPDMSASCFRAVEYAKAQNVLVSFDPNLRKELQSNPAARRRMTDMLSRADMVEPTLEEGRLLTGYESPEDVAMALHDLGPRLVVLTRDKDGALFSYDGAFLYAGGIDVPVVDPTGAGDTFAAALAYCLVEDYDLESAIEFCNGAATLVCTRRGAIGMALPTLEETMAFIQKHPCRIAARARVS